jgi:hypothetical protein
MDMKNEQLYNRYDLEQVIEFIPAEKKYYFWALRDSIFLVSMEENKYILYDNGEYRIWLL